MRQVTAETCSRERLTVRGRLSRVSSDSSVSQHSAAERATRGSGRRSMTLSKHHPKNQKPITSSTAAVHDRARHDRALTLPNAGRPQPAPRLDPLVHPTVYTLVITLVYTSTRLCTLYRCNTGIGDIRRGCRSDFAAFKPTQCPIRSVQKTLSAQNQTPAQSRCSTGPRRARPN